MAGTGRTKAQGEKVEVRAYIANVPAYRQGDDDRLCGYYCVWAMRVAVGTSRGTAAEEYAASCQSSPTPDEVLYGMWWNELGRRLNGYVKPRTSGRARTVWETAWESVRSGRPVVVWLPYSALFPAGHYMVAKGACRHRGVDYLIVVDPARGERWLSYTEFSCKPLDNPRRAEHGSWAAWPASVVERKLPGDS